MKPELEKELYNKYPIIFDRRNLGATGSSLYFGIFCGDGWYNLIDNCCFTIINYCKKYNKPIPPFEQIKEKFGGLRIYLYDYSEDIDNIISIYENLSMEICEYCGKDGTTQGSVGWIKSLCYSCRKIENMKRKLI